MKSQNSICFVMKLILLSFVTFYFFQSEGKLKAQSYSQTNGDQRKAFSVVLDTVKNYGIINTQLALGNQRVYRFNEQNQLEEEHWFAYNFMAQELQARNRNLYVYDTDGIRIQDTLYRYDVDLGKWNLSSLTDFEYDLNNQLIRSESVKWNDHTLMWEPMGITENEYSNGLITLSTSYEWDETTNDYFITSRFVFTYTEDNFPEETLSFFYNEMLGSLQLQSRAYREYNDDGLVNLIESYLIHTPSGELRIRNRQLLFYEDMILSEAFLYRSPVFQMDTMYWLVQEKNNFFYNESGKQEFVLVYSWNESGLSWDLTNRFHYVYDEYGNQTDRYLEELEDQQLDLWRTMNQLITEYNYNYPPGTYLTVNIDSTGHMISQSSAIQFLPFYRINSLDEYIYRENTVSTKDFFETIRLQIFPNPAAEYFTIDYAVDFPELTYLSVTDFSGRLVYQTQYTGAEILESGQWPAGMYFVLLRKQNGELLGSGTLVKP